MVATRDHDASPAHNGARGGPQLGREFRGDFDVGKPGDPVTAEERSAPSLTPDEAHGERRAVLYLFVRPDLDVRFDHTGFADSTEVGDHDTLGEEGVGPDDRFPSDHRLLDHCSGTDLNTVPDDATFHIGTRMDDRFRSYHRVGDPGSRANLGSPAHNHRTGESRRVVDACSRVEPYRVPASGMTLPGNIHPDPPLQDIQA